MQLTSIGLCLELIEQVWGVQLTGTGFCLELNRAGLGLAGKMYRILFGTE